MKRKTMRIIGAMLLLPLASATFLAHHGSAGYDTSNIVTLTGTVTRVELVNPHSMIYIDVKGDKGQVDNWALEGSPPMVLARAGLSKETFKVGVEVSVIGFPPRAQYACCGSFSSLENALAYSPGALDHLKAAHILQAGELRLAGETRQYGMGPRFKPAQ